MLSGVLCTAQHMERGTTVAQRLERVVCSATASGKCAVCRRRFATGDAAARHFMQAHVTGCYARHWLHTGRRKKSVGERIRERVQHALAARLLGPLKAPPLFHCTACTEYFAGLRALQEHYRSVHWRRRAAPDSDEPVRTVDEQKSRDAAAASANNSDSNSTSVESQVPAVNELKAAATVGWRGRGARARAGGTRRRARFVPDAMALLEAEPHLDVPKFVQPPHQVHVGRTVQVLGRKPDIPFVRR